MINQVYGEGRCAACGCPTKAGYLMCGPDWRKVPPELRRMVNAQLSRWNEGASTLGDLRDIQEAAIAAATGKG